MSKGAGMVGRAMLAVVLALLASLAAVSLGAGPATGAVPAGFNDTLAANVGQPTALAFTPDGRMLVTSKPGELRVRVGETTETVQALDISGKVCDNLERGLLGVAVDPQFETNNFVYLYYTFNKFGVCPEQRPARRDNPVNRVSRFVLSNENRATGETVLVDNIPSPRGNHNAGDLHFGKDGFLYVSVGDGGCDYANPSRCGPENPVATRRNNLNGKILRIDRDGNAPPTNPFVGPSSVRCNQAGRAPAGRTCREIFATGLRNPFRMAFDPDAAGTSFRINDVGSNAWEEIDRGRRGAFYGWNLCQGRHDNSFRPGSVNCSAPRFSPPIHEYSHKTGCRSVTGGAFVPDGVWPAAYDDAYLFGDFICNRIFALTPAAGGGLRKTTFATGLAGGPVSMAFGPSGASRDLYYTTFAGEVRRISDAG